MRKPGRFRVAGGSAGTGPDPGATPAGMRRGAAAAGKVRLKDIARATGYSTNTVSLALRDSVRLPHATRERIRKVAADLDYFPNVLARALVGSRSYSIGLVLTDILNPTLTSVAQEVSNFLYSNGYSTLFATSNNQIDREIDVIKAFRARQADGILVFPVHHRRVGHLAQLRSIGYPVVSLANVPDSLIDTVCLHERRGACLAVEHLLELGHRDIAILDAASPLGNFEKRDGYRDAHRCRGIPVQAENEVLVDGHGIAEGYTAMQGLHHRAADPSAIFATSDPVALGVLRWCEENSVHVPEELSIIGFDDIELAQMAGVSLSTVRFPVREIAAAAVGHLKGLIEGDGELPVPAQRQFEPELIARASTARPGPRIACRTGR